RCHRGGCCPPMPAAMHWDAPGCESSAGSLPCCGHTLDRLHVAPGCGACGSCDSCAPCAPHGGLFGGLFGSLRSSLGCPKCASGCCETCAPAACDTCGAVPTAAPASDYYHQAPAVQPLPPAVPAPADEDLGVPPVVNESARLPGYLRGY
ncbi:MAG: hypothetical protein KDD69_20045, partial [Bdellovibrionales bacterium]|nr:hypothetical protein [Bdellovibrionales bacterium]